MTELAVVLRFPEKPKSRRSLAQTTRENKGNLDGLDA